MRVLLVNDYREGGGAEVVVQAEADLLQAAGHAVECFTGEDAGGRRLTAYVRNRRAVRRLEATIARFRPDVVHYHNIYHVLSPAVLAGGGRGDPRPRRVLTAHDYHLICPNAGLRAFDGPDAGALVEPESLRDVATIRRRRWDARSAVHAWLKKRQHLVSYRGGESGDQRRRLDLVLTPATSAADVLKRGGLEVPVSVLPNPFEVSPEGGDDGGISDRWPGDTAASGERCVIAGRVAEEKGVRDLVAAWPDSGGPAGDARLLVVGDGPDRAACERLVAERGLEARISFTGTVPRSRAVAAIRAADRLLVASRVPEVAPMVVLEAIAGRTAVLSRPLDAVEELIAPSRGGLTADLTDPAALAAALEGPRWPDRGRDDAGAQAFLAARTPKAHLAGLLAAYAAPA